MPKKSKKLSTTQKEYQKQVKRIKQFISRAEKRGYRFENKESLIPPKPKRITQASIRKLKEIKPITLYKKSTYLTDTGEVVKGTIGRTIERKESARKGAQKRKQKLQQLFSARAKTPSSQPLPTIYDILNDVVYNNILDMINNVARDHQKASAKLKALLDHEIDQFGKTNVLKALMNSPQDAIESAQVALNYNPGDTRHDDAIRELDLLIRGSIPTIEESKELQNSILEDTYTDYGKE